MFELLTFAIRVLFILLDVALTVLLSVFGALFSILGGALSGLGMLFLIALVVLFFLWLLVKVFNRGKAVTVSS
jgi:hypothetical protein